MISLDTPNTLKASKVLWPCKCFVYHYTFQNHVFQNRAGYIQ